MTDHLTALFKNARLSYDEVLDAMRLQAAAELEAAETDAERAACHKNLVAVLKEHESWVEGQREAACVPGASVLKVNAKRLEAEIHLEQAKMKLAKGRK